MTHNVERRAGETSSGTPPAGPAELREPFRKVRADISQIGQDRKADSGLTKRERKVKDLLLRELKKGSDTKLLTWAEIQNLEKTLNVEWIDEQIASAEKQLKIVPWATVGYALLVLFQFFQGLKDAMESPSLVWNLVAVLALVVIFGTAVAAPLLHRRSVRRKIFIYEALRELAGPDEAGITLDRAVRDADDLIARIVDMELAAEAEKPAKSIGRVRL
ncbi:MAG: hypothetical protein HKN29_07735 [Rhodothermales bacterium]|nr:hypothetical protein [Rhodothermales bacterium]